jgi:chromosome segregation ATPase
MDNWDNENTNEQGFQEPQMTTDDLVLLIGEKEINLRHSGKKIAALGGIVQNLQGQLAAAESASITIANDKESAMQQAQNTAKELAGLRERILSLEDQVHSVALERDEARQQILKLEEANKQLAEKRSANQVKNDKRTTSSKV